MRKHQIALIAVFGLLCTAAPALAHHSFAVEYDGDKLVAVKGILTRVDWQNPHVWFFVDVKDENGNVTNWGFETSSPTRMHHEYPNIRRDFLASIGKVVSVVACPAKRVPTMGSSESIKLAEGSVLKIGVAYTGSENEDQVLQNVK